MGGKNVAKKYRSTKAGNVNTLLVESLDALGQVRYDADKTIKGKTLGLDLSVVLHKALGDITSALEFQIQPPVPVSKIDDVLNKMILLFKRCDVKLLVCTEGKHHKYKGRVNEQRKKKQSGAQESVDKLVEQFKREPTSKLIDEIKKQMKYSVYVREDILAHAVDLLEENGIQVLSAPYEADFQLVYWELMGITEGTITVDSDIFCLGSKLLVDNLSLQSKIGKCFLIEKKDVLDHNVLGSNTSSWSDNDLIIYLALCGCDFIRRLLGLKDEQITDFMKKWKKTSTRQEEDSLLRKLCRDKFWPKDEGRGRGDKATDFPQKIRQVIEFMRHAPVFHKDEAGEVTIVPLRPLPDSTRTHADVIGFDPAADFAGMNLEAAHDLRVWCRTGSPLRKLEYQVDPIGGEIKIPHGANIRFDKRPIEFIPTNVLIMWLYYHGVPHPKGAGRPYVIDQVKLALQKCKELDYSKMEIDEAINRRSYVSFDMFEAESEVEYCTDQATIFEFIRGRIPNISDDLINELFGEGKNGVRLRSFKRFDSGCLDVAKLKMSQAKIKGVDEPVILIELPCTPSMKSEIYGGALVFSRDGVYLASKSRCDCPNGCYFCSHMLAKFVYFRLIQIRPQWTAEDFKSVMPDPIKSLQGLPIQVQYVFKQEDEQCRIASKIVARELAREVPGYSSNQSSGVDRTEDIEEARAMLDDIERSKLGGGKKVDSISLSDMLDKFLANTKEAVELDTASNCGRKKKSEKAKVKSQDIHAYNQETMNGPLPRIRQQEKILRHNRTQQLFGAGLLSADNALSHQLDHFELKRRAKLRELDEPGEDLPFEETVQMEFIAKLQRLCVESDDEADW